VAPEATNDVYGLLSRLNERMAILLLSHDMVAISAFTKTVACLDRRLMYHRSKELTFEMLESMYGCPLDLIAHGVPHRVLAMHGRWNVDRLLAGGGS
jgi:zinc transport system ATP-binding protein